MLLLMTPKAPVGAPMRLPLALSVAVLAFGATACGSPPEPMPNPDGGCSMPCFLVQNGDAGSQCVCA